MQLSPDAAHNDSEALADARRRLSAFIARFSHPHPTNMMVTLLGEVIADRDPVRPAPTRTRLCGPDFTGPELELLRAATGADPDQADVVDIVATRTHQAEVLYRRHITGALTAHLYVHPVCVQRAAA